MAYFVIHCTEDGEVRVYQRTKEQILKGLEDTEGGRDFFAQAPEDPDPNYWGKSSLIIKGEIVYPEPRTSVVTWDLP